MPGSVAGTTARRRAPGAWYWSATTPTPQGAAPVGGIAIDPADPNHAFVSFSGYNAATPDQPADVVDPAPEPTPDSRMRAPGKMSASIRIGPRSFG